jgi:hypothetical protein
MYEDKFVAFIDILGFSDLVRQSEEGGPDAPTVEDLLALTKLLGDTAGRARFAERGPAACPHAPYISKDLGFRVNQFSDSVVVSAEVSPAGLINLLFHCFGIPTALLARGHLCRGYVTRGKIVHTDTQFFGSGLLRAVDGERRVSIFQIDAADSGTPFVELDSAVCDYIAAQDDSCVKTLYGRMVENDGRVTAISPFPALKKIPAAVIRDDFDPARWKKQIGVSRTNLLQIVTRLENAETTATERGRAKIDHYKRKLAEVLAVKDRDDELMDRLASIYPAAPTGRTAR